METLPFCTEAHAVTAGSVLSQEPRELQLRNISTRLTKHREITEEEIEFIEMRYQTALALKNLEDLFAEGQLDCL
jgi:hypothetical protein